MTGAGPGKISLHSGGLSQAHCTWIGPDQQGLLGTQDLRVGEAELWGLLRPAGQEGKGCAPSTSPSIWVPYTVQDWSVYAS